jgi:hypothetical protein
MVQPCVIQKNGKSKNKTNQKQTNKQKHKTKEHYVCDWHIFGARDIQKTVGIPMDISCAPPFADLIFYSYQTDFNRNENNFVHSFYCTTFR